MAHTDNTAKLHKDLASKILTEQYSDRPKATPRERWEMERQARNCAEFILANYVPTTVKWVNGKLVVDRKPLAPMLKTIGHKLHELETTMAAMVSEWDRPQMDEFYVRRAPGYDAFDEARVAGTDEELATSAEETEQENVALRRRIRKLALDQFNKQELQKAGLAPRSSWKDDWARIKAEMRELGAEIRENEGWIRQVERELRLRDSERHSDATFGVECGDPMSRKVHSEDELAHQLQRDEGRDYRTLALTPCHREPADGSTPRPVPADHSELDTLERAYLAEDLWELATA